MKILLTGATGFVGRFLTKELLKISKHELNIVIRSIDQDLADNTVPNFFIKDLNDQTNWDSALRGCDVVIHLAARVHVMNEEFADPLSEFRRVNVEGTLNLARQAAALGVKRFIFISTIGVNGVKTQGEPFNESNIPNPKTNYAVSKCEAERALLKLAEQTGLQVVIIRPPLIYGPDAPANFGRLMAFLKKGMPIPFAMVKNKRSFISIVNLVDFIILCIDHPKAANQFFVISDGNDVSTPELIKLLSSGMGISPRLYPMPVGIMKLGSKLIGKDALFQQLCGSLQIDISKSRRILGWSPKLSLEEGLLKTASENIKN